MQRKKQQIEEEEQAVSAVIAVILMVAVAVAMAAVAYAYFTGMIGRNAESSPVIDFTPNFDTNTIMVTHSDTDFNWEDIRILASKGNVTEVVQDSTGPKHGAVQVGDKIFLNDAIPTLTGTVTVTITHTPSGTTMGDFTFDNIK